MELKGEKEASVELHKFLAWGRNKKLLYESRFELWACVETLLISRADGSHLQNSFWVFKTTPELYFRFVAIVGFVPGYIDHLCFPSVWKLEQKGLWLKAAQVVVLPRVRDFYLDVHFLDFTCLPWVGIMIAVCLSSKLKAGGGMCFGVGGGGVTQFSSAFSSVISLWLSIIVWVVGVCVCVCVCNLLL